MGVSEVTVGMFCECQRSEKRYYVLQVTVGLLCECQRSQRGWNVSIRSYRGDDLRVSGAKVRILRIRGHSGVVI